MTKSIFDNAIASIELGVLDFQEAERDERRGLSATRNLYAGVLLLVKERLRRIDEQLIFSQVVPTIEATGVVWQGRGKGTADFRQLRDRWNSLGLRDFGWKRLEGLQGVRNNVEHYFHAEGSAPLRQAVSNTFALVTALFHDHLNETPAHVFSERVWTVMQCEAATEAQLLAACRATREAVQGVPAAIRDIWDDLECFDCYTAMLRVTAGTDYPDVELVCDGCGDEPSVAKAVSQFLRAIYPTPSYHTQVKDGEVDPIADCPTCCAAAFLLDEDRCMVCLESRPYPECKLCQAWLSVDEQHGYGYCSGCRHMMSKD